MGKRYNDLHSLAKFLRQELLPDVPVRVRRLSLPSDTWADCDGYYDERGFVIRIHKRVSEQYALFFLMHEFAHVLSWDKQQKDHGVSWGIAMSKVYCIYLKWINGESKAACSRRNK